MVFGWFRRSARSEIIGKLYGRLGEAARSPELFLRLRIPDTVEGRLESLMLHAFLVMRRLKALPAPGADVAQDLVDQLFQHIDHGLRELGVGDTSVPKRMKSIGRNFYGRVQAYEAALDQGGGEPLRQALERNIPEVDAAGLALWAERAEAHLATLDLDAILGDSPLFPPPEGGMT